MIWLPNLKEKLRAAEQKLTIFEEMCSRALRNKEGMRHEQVRAGLERVEGRKV